MMHYTLSIEAEGDYGADIEADTEADAADMAAGIIACEGDYDLAPGESVAVRYWLTPAGGERSDSYSVTVSR
jgi:hypothetical protein